MDNQWRKNFLVTVLSVTMAAGSAVPAYAGAAPDGKTDAANLAAQMGMDQRWESWKTEWEQTKNDWTQISLTPGSDCSQLNFAWYSKKEKAEDGEQTAEPETQTFEDAAAADAAFGDGTGEAVNQDETAAPAVETEAAADAFSDAGNSVQADAEAPTETEVQAEAGASTDAEIPAALNESGTDVFASEAGTEEFASEEEKVLFDSENKASRDIAFMVDTLLGEAASTDAPKLIIGEGRNMKNARAYVAQQQEATPDVKNNETYLSNKVTAVGLNANTSYFYSYQLEDGTYTEPAEYRTQDSRNYSFIYVGDPQIGSSNALKGADTAEFYQAQSDSVRSDAFNWETTLNAAMDMTGGTASFVLSAGDQIQTNQSKAPGKSPATSEVEYAGYLSPDILKDLPVATTVGNHDADNANYTYHFNTPNNSELGSNGIVGGDYWFTHGNTLFMMLNTQGTNVAEHKQFMDQAIAQNPNCTWRVVTLHQDIYGSAEHSNEPEITNLRYNLVPYFEENDIDVVLSGHDHAYSRSLILSGGKSTVSYSNDEFGAALGRDMDAGENAETRYVAPGNISQDSKDPSDIAYLNYLNAVMDKDAIVDTEDGETVVNPDGILYMTANSSSGSKYYDLVPRTQAYVAGRWQADVPTYSVVNVTDTTFTINTYRTDNDQKIDDSFTIKKGVKEKIADTTISEIKNQVYTGKAITPSVKVTINGKTLKQDKDYTLKYSSNVNTGEAKVTVTGKGNFKGTKTAAFKIVPKKGVITSAVSKSAKTATVTLGKLGGKISGSRIVIADNASFKNAKSVYTKKSVNTLKSLKSGKTYYVKARGFKTISGKRVYGAYSETVKVKVK